MGTFLQTISRAVVLVAAMCILALPIATAAVPINGEACDGVQSAVCSDSEFAERNDVNPLVGKDGIITKVVTFLGFVVGVISVIILIVAGIRFAINGSNASEVTKARNTVIYAVVGIVVALVAQGVVQFILVKL